MGLTVLEIEIANPADPARTERVEFLIDSGTPYSMVPTPLLERIGGADVVFGEDGDSVLLGALRSKPSDSRSIRCGAN